MDNNFEILSAAVSDRGLSEKRPQNEDSYLEMNSNGLFAVADGVGGAQAGDVASQMAVEILGEAFAHLPANSDAEEVMKIAIERANEAIYQMASDLPQLSTMATTIVALHVSGNIATIGHVGDSRLYRLDKKGNLYRETQDHSVVEEEVRAGRMTMAQAATHPSRNVISRALGADSSVEVDMKTIMFEPPSTFLICSDGITRHLDDFELRDLLLSGETPSEIVAQMKEICYERGAEDNLTAVIAKVSDAVAGGANARPAAPAIAGAAIESPDGLEESTVTSARAEPPSEKSEASFYKDDGAASSEADSGEEISNRSFVVPELTDFEPTEKITEPDSASDAEILEEPETKSAAEKNEVVPVVTARETAPAAPVYEIEKPAEKSFFSKILSPILSMLLGAILGAGIYHLWAQRNLEPEIPQLPPAPTTNIPLTSFEDLRRAVDKSPEQYVFTTNNQADSPEDYYLLGRAYLLSGKYPEAKTAFEEARNRLAQAEEVNAQTLANEIAMGLAVVNDPFAQKAFQNDIKPDGVNANTKTNANSINQGQRNSNGL